MNQEALGRPERGGVAVDVVDVSRVYRTRRHEGPLWRQLLRPTFDTYTALDRVNLQIRAGECLGLVARTGRQVNHDQTADWPHKAFLGPNFRAGSRTGPHVVAISHPDRRGVRTQNIALVGFAGTALVRRNPTHLSRAGRCVSQRCRPLCRHASYRQIDGPDSAPAASASASNVKWCWRWRIALVSCCWTNRRLVSTWSPNNSSGN